MQESRNRGAVAGSRLDRECDVLVVGGGLGGVAAALAAARLGCRVCLTEENRWLGGQCTSQGVSALDEHQYIERCGGTASYYEFRNRVRAHYRDSYRLAAGAAAAPYLNPGVGWVSRLCFEPRAGLGALLQMLLPHVQAGRLEIFYGARVCGAQVQGDRIRSVELAQPEYDRRLRFHPVFVLDATELGDVLPLLGVPYATGAESREETGEPHAREVGPAPQLVQSFTFPFVVDFRPGEDHTIPRPPGYERNRNGQPYTLTLRYGDRDLTYKLFEPVADLPGPFWTYRRILAADNFAPGQVEGDLAMTNWPGNDYRCGNLIDQPAEEQVRILQEAKDLSLGFLYWLQTEVPRDDGQGRGYPELRLRRDVLGTHDGLSQHPYIRESRRLQALRTVREQDVSARYQAGARAAHFPDSAGLGLYPIDIHGVAGDLDTNHIPGEGSCSATRPFQIPLGALVSRHLANLLAACKNLGVTHLTNGCYRLHPVEWNIGEAAGTLAAFCLGQQQPPARVVEEPGLRRAVQQQLLRAGVPLYWYEDVPLEHPAHAATNLLAVEGAWPGQPEHLRFEPEAPVSAAELHDRCRQLGVSPEAAGSAPCTRAELACRLAALRFGS